MLILLDTSTPTCQLTIVIDGESHHYEWEAGRELARGILEFLRDKLALHHASFGDISGIGVMRGPGSFTGLRIGLTVMNTLASDRQIPIVGMDGEDWRQQAIIRLENGQNDQLVMPEYGAEANITQPRK